MTIPPWLHDPTILAIIGVATTIVCTVLGILVTYRFTKRKYEAQNIQIIEEEKGINKIINIIKGGTVYNIGNFKKEVRISKEEKKEGSD